MLRIIIFILIGIAAGYLFHDYLSNKKIDKYPHIVPSSIFQEDCLPANKVENELFEKVGSLYSVAQNQNNLSILIGLNKFLSQGVYRYIDKKPFKVCSPDWLYKHVGSVITESNGLNYRLQEEHLKLIQQIRNPSDYIISKVSDIAFKDKAVYEYLNYGDFRIDLRPRARTILAQYKESAKQYAKDAYQDLNAITQVGTSSAQIVASANYLDSLDIIEAMMFEILESVPDTKPIPFDERDRFIELGYALILAGDAATNHTAPLEEMLNREVMSWAGHFGRIELKPKKVCDIINAINPDNKITTSYQFCMDDDYPYAKG